MREWWNRVLTDALNLSADSLPRGGRKGCYKKVQFHAAFSSLWRKGSYQNAHFHAEPFHHYQEEEERDATKMYIIMLPFHLYDENEKAPTKNVQFHAKPFHYYEEEEEKAATKTYPLMRSLFIITKKRLVQKCTVAC
jgi:hypothetical protein